MNIPESIYLFYKADWITFGIRKRLNLSPMIATILWYLLFNGILLIIAIRDGIVFSIGSRVGLLNDFGWWIITTLGFNATIYTFLWLPDGVTKTISGLIRNKVIGFSSSHKNQEEKETLDIYIQRFFRSYSNRLWYLIPSVIAIPLLNSLIQSHKHFLIWETASNLSLGFTIFLYMLFFFLFVILLTRVIIVMVWLNKLFKDFDVDVRVLHPDKAGGLAPLSRFGMAIVYMIVIIAISNVFGDISEATITSKAYIDVVRQPFVFSVYIAYCVFSSLAFFTPLFVAHTSMKKAKNNFITEISDQFEIELANIQTLLAEDSAKLKKSLLKLEELQKLYSVVSKFPVWPFNIGNLAGFFGAIISPFLISLISIVIEQFFK
jgi:hypothetical protein